MKGGGVNDALALSEREVLQLRRFANNGFSLRASFDEYAPKAQELLKRSIEHIGVLTNRNKNFGQQYRAIEKAAETLAERTWDEGWDAAMTAVAIEKTAFEAERKNGNPYRKPE